MAKLSWEGVPDWDIMKLNLPITYGRYALDVSKLFQRYSQKECKKTYLKDCASESFNDRKDKIAKAFVPINLQN